MFFVFCFISSALISSTERNPTPHTRYLSEVSAAALRCNVKRFKLVLSGHRRGPTHRDECDFLCPNGSSENPISTEKSKTLEWIELDHLSISDCKSTKQNQRHHHSGMASPQGFLWRQIGDVSWFDMILIWQNEMTKLYKNALWFTASKSPYL